MFHYRKAKAKMEFGDYEAAKRIAQLAHSEYPNDQGIGKLLADVDRYVTWLSQQQHVH